MPVVAETDQDQNSDHAENQSNGNSQASGKTLCVHGSGQTPFAKKIPDADAEMEGGRKNSDHGEREKPWIMEKVLDFRVGRFAVGHPTLGIQVPADINEGDQTGVALRGEKPISYPGIGREVGFAANPDVHAVER